jgi:hypothetical protein
MIIPSPAHPLTEAQLLYASRLARMILPVTQDAIDAQNRIQAALETHNLSKVEKAMGQAWKVYRNGRGVCTMEWRRLAQRWATINRAIWEELHADDQKEDKVA